ncbi:MAG TPA: hypothetical protein DCP92_13485 [Nitrospiraceae bacterium]|jgi:hypothetical protein|nr:hypothetical protein [Nitrospiraceae bacterium]
MESLVFVFGMMAGGIIAVTIMAMFFVAKSADEADEIEVAATGYRPSYILQHETEVNTAAPRL